MTEGLHNEIEGAGKLGEDVTQGPEVRPSLLDLLRGSSFLADEDYMRFVEVVLEAVKGGAAVGSQASEWCLGTRRLLHARRDPPLHLLWAYAVLQIPSWSKTDENDLTFTAKALLQSLKAAVVGNTSAPIAIAALAPVVATIFKAVQEFCKPLGFSKVNANAEIAICEEGSLLDIRSVRKKAKRTVRILQEIIREVLSFIVICSNSRRSALDCSFGLPLAPSVCQNLSCALTYFSLLLEVLKVKEKPKQMGGTMNNDLIKVMFPLVSNTTIKALQRYQANMEDICGIVTTEVVLLQLVLKLIDIRIKLKKQNQSLYMNNSNALENIRALAIHGVTAARSSGTDIMLDMLLSPRLPVTMLGNEGEAILKGILYEAVLVEKPCFGHADMPPSITGEEKDSTVFLKKLAIARKAVHHYRSCGEHNFAVTLLEAFSTLSVHSQLLNWFANVKIKHKPAEAVLQNAQTLIGWLINLDDRKFKGIYDKLTSTCGFKARSDLSQKASTVDHKHGINDSQNNSGTSEAFSSKAPDEDIFFIDTTGEKCEDERSETIDKAFIAAAMNMQGIASSGRRKKKEMKIVYGKRRSIELKNPQQHAAEWELSDTWTEVGKKRKQRDSGSSVSDGDSDSYSSLDENSESFHKKMNESQQCKWVDEVEPDLEKFGDGSLPEYIQTDTDVT
eukprot:c25130_g1_i1 orf=185-2206(+)